MDDRHPGPSQHAVIHAIQACDFTILVGNQRGPVKLRLVQLPAIAFGFLGLLAEVRGVTEQLFGNTAHVDAGAT